MIFGIVVIHMQTSKIKDFELKYAYMNEEDEQIQWEEEWDFQENQSMPYAILLKFTVVVKNDDKKVVFKKVIERKIVIPQGVFGQIE